MTTVNVTMIMSMTENNWKHSSWPRQGGIPLPSRGKVGRNRSTGPLYLDPTVISFNSFYFSAEKITARKIVYYDFHSLLYSLTQCGF